MDEIALIELIKSLLVNTNYDDNKGQVCLNNAISAICEYVHKDNINNKNVVGLFPYQIAQLTVYYYKSFDDMNIQSKSQGNRSITYGAKGIPDEIKKTLPRYVKGF